MITARAGGAPSLGFPHPPGPLVAYGRTLTVHRVGKDADKAKVPPLDRTPRPWVPETMAEEVLLQALAWWDAVSEWINASFLWQVQQARAIPPCWPHHPHLVHELPVLAWSRYTAGEALEVSPMEDWQRYALPSFLNRLADRLGSMCEKAHDPWPRAAEFARYRGEEEVEERGEAFELLSGRMSRSDS